ncbi:ATP-binding protein [Neisseria meningitidis]|nr:ATP-binding protein [Neisseria meningitidis]MBG8657601.1 ATP-binding protein [Neisseria meningitidis]MBG8763162.1 ATP-binding protein [Neisseria meningitidis]MBJ7752481.1 ATP-binding protein [Neisseria meningitidis]
MRIETENALELFFPKPALSLVYFEAIANSLDANATKINIEINIQDKTAFHTLKIKITDNGDGFIDENFNRFKTLLTPKDEAHKGIGRLVFLKYFKKVKIQSEWLEGSKSFTFDKDDIKNITERNKQNKTKKTELLFCEFTGKKIHKYDYIRPIELKFAIIEHFLPKLNTLTQQSIPFEITIDLKIDTDGGNLYSDKVSITKEDLPNLIIDTANPISIQSNLGQEYKIKTSYLIQEVDKISQLKVAFNIDNRTVLADNFLKRNVLPNTGYYCIFLFESELFNNCADMSRQRFNLPDEISENQLNRLLRNKIGEILSDRIPVISEKNKETKQNFERDYPHLLGYFDKNIVGLIDKDEALDSAQSHLFQEQKRILEAENLSDEQYQKSLEFSSRVLTEYVLYREKIISKMEDLVNSKSKEAEIHNLIIPRYHQFEQESLVSNIYQNNAWLLDDKFMSFRTILSEQEMRKIIQEIQLDDEKKTSDERGRPDIALIFSADPTNNEKVDVVVIEIKDSNDDLKNSMYAINQLLDRSNKLVNYCKNIQRMWYYAVVDIDHTMNRQLMQSGYSPLFSKGKIFYKENKTFIYKDETESETIGEVPTPTFVISFDAIVNDAKSRNHTFLEVLRENMKRFA